MKRRTKFLAILMSMMLVASTATTTVALANTGDDVVVEMNEVVGCIDCDSDPCVCETPEDEPAETTVCETCGEELCVCEDVPAEETIALTPYQQLMAAENVDVLYDLLYNENTNYIYELESLSADELTALKNHADAIYNASIDDYDLYEMICDGIGTYTGDYSNNGAEVLAQGPKTVTGNETISVSGTLEWSGTVTVDKGATLTIELATGATGTIRKTFDGHLIKVVDGGKLVVRGSSTQQLVIDGNKKEGSCVVGSGTKTANFDFDNVTIQNFSGGESSAGIVRVSGVANFDNCIFQDNYAFKGYAGTLVAGGSDNYCLMNVRNCKFLRNKSSGWGGGILWAANNTSDGTTTGTKSHAYVDNCIFDGNTAQIGGAISNEANMTVTNCEIFNNKAKAGGGIGTFPYTLAEGESSGNACGLILGDGNKIYGNETTVTEDTFDPSQGENATVFDANGQYVSGVKSVSYPSGGAGIWCYMNKPNWTCAMTIGSDNEIYGNTSKSQGGGVLVHKDLGGETKLTINGEAKIYNNNAVNGGGIALRDALLFVNGGSIYKNIASASGGGAYVNGGNFTMTGGTFGGNDTTDENNEIISNGNTAVNGGGIYVNNGTVTMSDGNLVKNSATQNGGAVYVTGGNFSMTGGTASGNTAKNGGAAYVSGGSFDMSGSAAMSSNAASGNGGAAYVSSGDFTMTGGTLGGTAGNGNTALNGGAVYVSGGDFNMISGTMSHNTAIQVTDGAAEDGDEGYGGAVYAAGTKDEQTDKYTGGNIYIGLEQCDGYGDDNNIKHNGAGLSAEYQNLEHPTVTNNKAVFGGAMAVNGGSAYVYCGTMKDNESDNAGTGKNIFMMNDNSNMHHYLDNSVIGETVNGKVDHGIVSVGGKLSVYYGDENQPFVVTIHYAANTGSGSKYVNVVWEGTAPPDYDLNLPYCPKTWRDEQAKPQFNRAFVGWTQKPMAEHDNAIRDRGDYLSVGDVVKIEDQNPNDGVNSMDFYAVWAPLTNPITYAYSLDGVNITDSTDENAGFTLEGKPTDYRYSPVGESINIGEPVKAGYTFVGWRMYSSTEKMSNWDMDPKVCPATEISQLKEVGYTTVDNKTLADYITSDNKLNTDRNFGDITLVAVFEPAFTDMVIEKVNGNDYTSYVFTIEGTRADGNGAVEMQVVIPAGEESVTLQDLPIGKYMVTEETAWSWRESTSGITVTQKAEGEQNPENVISPVKGNNSTGEFALNDPAKIVTVTYTNTLDTNQWLSGDDYKLNWFGNLTNTVAEAEDE